MRSTLGKPQWAGRVRAVRVRTAEDTGLRSRLPSPWLARAEACSRSRSTWPSARDSTAVFGALSRVADATCRIRALNFIRAIVAVSASSAAVGGARFTSLVSSETVPPSFLACSLRRNLLPATAVIEADVATLSCAHAASRADSSAVILASACSRASLFAASVDKLTTLRTRSGAHVKLPCAPSQP